jgi:hypothetical protein
LIIRWKLICFKIDCEIPRNPHRLPNAAWLGSRAGSRSAQTDVLVVDDWAMAALSDVERRDFLEICDDRYQTRSTILTSPVPVADWHAQIGDPTAADSILDRLVHNAHRIELGGESMRKNAAEPRSPKRWRCFPTAPSKPLSPDGPVALSHGGVGASHRSQHALTDDLFGRIAPRGGQSGLPGGEST